MSQIADRSRQAREKLTLALSLLQRSAGGELNSVVIPVARAMGSLHTIEYSRGLDLGIQGPIALGCVRAALEALQSTPVSGEAEEAMAQIAGSLGLLHGLSQEAELSQAAQPSQGLPVDSMPLGSTRPSAQAPVQASAPQIRVSHQPVPAARSGGLDATLPVSSMQRGVSGSHPLGSTQASIRVTGGQPRAVRGHVESARQAEAHGSMEHAGDTQASARMPGQPGPTGTQASPRYVPASPPLAQAPPHAAQEVRHPLASRSQGMNVPEAGSPVQDPFQSSKLASPPPVEIPAGVVRVEANLGAHSPTNFYKGLSGNDVVDDGGLFIASYDLPPLGTPLWLTVHMPGGYQFQALAIVKWSRAAGAGDSVPGYGCTFRSLSSDARQLVYRYARNREPLFHDDF